MNMNTLCKAQHMSLSHYDSMEAARRALRRLHLAVGLTLLSSGVASADIIYGGRTFHDDAFADVITASGSFGLANASSASEALIGFSPTRAVTNLGADALITVEFIDLWAENASAADIVLYETHSTSPFAIAVRTPGGSFSPFVEYVDADLAYSGETTNIGFGTTFVYELGIDLDDFGLASGALVDAIQIRRGAGASGDVGGDPSMIGVQNAVAAAVPEPSSLAIVTVGIATLALASRRRRRAGHDSA